MIEMMLEDTQISPPTEAPLPVSSQPIQTAPTPPQKENNSVVVILLLIFLYPIGVLVMWLEKKWSTGVRILISLPLLLTVIGVFFLGPLLAVTLIAINPARQFSQANNTKRQSDINAILNAVSKYTADQASLPQGINTTSTEIAKTGADICEDLVPTYLAAMPTDPKGSLFGKNINDCTTTYSTGYEIKTDDNGDITVNAPLAELSITIRVSRPVQ